MVSFGWLKTCMLLDRVVDILWYLFWPCSFQVLRTHFCAWVTFERFSNHRGLTWFHCDSYLNEKWFGCQASHEEEHIFLCRFVVTSILRPFWFDVFVKKSWPLPNPVKLQQLGWRGHRKWFTKACWWETISGVANWNLARRGNFLNILRLFGFEFILIMLFFYENSTWNWTHLYILLAALIGYTCYTGDHDVVICSWGHGICYQEGLRSQDRR